MKKRLSLLVAVLMVLTLVPASAFALDEKYSSVQIVEDSDGSANFKATFKVEKLIPQQPEQSVSNCWGMMLNLMERLKWKLKVPVNLGQLLIRLHRHMLHVQRHLEKDVITISGKVKFDNAKMVNIRLNMI